MQRPGCQTEPVPPRLPSILVPPIGFAHRGARAHAPENTLEAFQLARRLGASGLETDAWCTADGEVVLDHDGVTGSRLRRRPIASVTRAELPSHIPTLGELYATCGTGFALSIDIKDADALPGVLDTARAAGGDAEANLWLCHPDLDTVASWRPLSSGAQLVHSTRLGRVGQTEPHANRLRVAGIDAVNLHHSEWSGGLIALYHRFERVALGWDAQFERTLDELLDAGIDGVFSDHVDRMVERIDRLTAAS